MLQDIGDPLTRMPWPPTPEGLLSASIDPIKDTAIEVYAYGLHHAGGCTHDSKAYQKVGDNIAVMHESSGLQMREGTKRLIEQGRDPMSSHILHTSSAVDGPVQVQPGAAHIGVFCREKAASQLLPEVGAPTPNSLKLGGGGAGGPVFVEEAEGI